MFDSKKTHFAKWANRNQDWKISDQFCGMKSKEDWTMHGVVRGVSAEIGIFEATYKHGKAHGLYRWIKDK